MPSASDQTSSQEPRTALIGVDWGTTSLRAYRMASDGRVLERTERDLGILKVEDAAFAKALDRVVGAWRSPSLPLILSGMIGSRQGWIEVPYLELPAKAADIAAALVRHPDDPAIHVVPGLAYDPKNLAPDVMRGEETQIIGALDDEAGSSLLVMPGTHSKWVLVENGVITWFATFMTGELFSVLKHHSILGRLMTDTGGQDDRQAFEQGLDGADKLPGGLLQKLFSARTLALFDRLLEKGVADYLSGLLIGIEIDEAFSNLAKADDRPRITIIGASNLAQRYLDAMSLKGLTALKAGEDAAAIGQHRLATKASLVNG